MFRIQFESGVIAHAMLVRIQAGQDVRVGGQGHDVVSVRVREDHPLRRDPVEKRCLHPGVAGEADRVGAKGVDGDEDDVVGLRRGDAHRLFAARDHEQRGDQKSRSHKKCPLANQRAFCNTSERKT